MRRSIEARAHAGRRSGHSRVWTWPGLTSTRLSRAVCTRRSRSTPSRRALSNDLVAAGHLGCKTGRGLYGDYDGEAIAALTERRARMLLALERLTQEPEEDASAPPKRPDPRVADLKPAALTRDADCAVIRLHPWIHSLMRVHRARVCGIENAAAMVDGEPTSAVVAGRPRRVTAGSGTELRCRAWRQRASSACWRTPFRTASVRRN